MFLYMFAFQLTSVVEQAFFVEKACRINHNYSHEICDNISANADIKKEVQVINRCLSSVEVNLLATLLDLNKKLSALLLYERLSCVIRSETRNWCNKMQTLRYFYYFFYRKLCLHFISGTISPAMLCQLLSLYF